jgi:hypothetical protein
LVRIKFTLNVTVLAFSSVQSVPGNPCLLHHVRNTDILRKQ